MKQTLGIVGAFIALILIVNVAAAEGRMNMIKETPSAHVRVIHASPNAPAVDVWVNGALALQNISFEQITDFTPLVAGAYTFQVVPTGATQPVVIDASMSLRPGKFYTIAATNVLEKITPVVITDNNRWAGQDKARVRFIHASPDAPAVDIAVQGGPILFKGVEFQETAKYIQVPASAYDLEVRIAGTDTVVLNIDGVSLEPRSMYTAVATGEVAQGTLNAVLAKDW